VGGKRGKRLLELRVANPTHVLEPGDEAAVYTCLLEPFWLGIELSHRLFTAIEFARIILAKVMKIVRSITAATVFFNFTIYYFVWFYYFSISYRQVKTVFVQKADMFPLVSLMTILHV
jgi:hypothetical protein